MESIVTSPIFIFLTGLAEIIIVILVVIILGYGVKIFKNLSKISEIAQIEAENIQDDIEDMRDDIKDGVRTTKKQLKVLASALTAKKAFSWIINGVKKAQAKKNKD